MIPFDRFTPNAKMALQLAEKEAQDIKVSYIGTEHLFLSLLSIPKSLAFSILTGAGVTLESVRMVLKAATTSQLEAEKTQHGLSPYLKKAIENAVATAHKYGHTSIGTEHLLYGIVSQKRNAAIVILENMHLSPNVLKRQIQDMFEQITKSKKSQQKVENTLDTFLQGLQGAIVGMSKGEDYANAHQHKANGTSTKTKSRTPALDYFTTDLIEKARKKELDPIIGRDTEIERMINILNRKNKNNPVIVGDAGVGKTAIVEGLAEKIIAQDVPDVILNKKILALSMGSVVAGTKYRGEFEQRIKDILEEASKSENEIILFIDELHTVVGAGSAEGSLDAANILKPALSRGNIQIIGATTTEEYRKHIEKDKALERRFQSIIVDEPSFEACLAILKGIRGTYESFHNLRITDEALKAAVSLGKRYIPDRRLPDKAIDLIDEAAAQKGFRSKSNTPLIKEHQKKLEAIEKSKQRAVASQNYAKAVKLKKEEEKIMEEIKKIKENNFSKSRLSGRITENDIAKVIGRMTGIPITKLMKTDAKRLLNLEKSLSKYIIGQDEAIKEIAGAIRRSRVGIANQDRPIASFIFMGPSGVGKTELVKVLTREVYNKEDALIKIDMSEFMERHNVSRLVGATAGYIGYEEGGQLTEAVRRNPYSVVLFDEIEKAHSDFFNVLLQILEDGYLTDAKGLKVDFRNTIIIMTSNIGADKLTRQAATIGFNLKGNDLARAEDAFDEKKEEALKEMKDKLRPEFLNRVDNTIVFRPLTHENIKDIVYLQIKYLQDRIEEQKIFLSLNDKAAEFIARESYQPEFGARMVRRKVQVLIEDPLAEKILNDEINEGETVTVRKEGKGLVLKSALEEKFTVKKTRKKSAVKTAV